jgi:phage terminase small subunit
MEKLTAKQKVFVCEYLKDFNGTRAAIRAGYSVRSACEIASETLRIPKIAKEIQRNIEERSMSASEVLLRLADIARGNITDLMDVTSAGFTVDLQDDDHQVKPDAKLIKRIRQRTITYLGKNDSQEDREVTDTEIELYSSLDALTTLAKVHKLMSDATVENKISLSDKLERALEIAWGKKAGSNVND